MSRSTIPRTRSGTPIKIPGRPRKDSEIGGLHLLIYPMFKSWLKKNKAAREEWAQITDKYTYFMELSLVTLLPHDEKSTIHHLEYCYKVSPDLTCRALLITRKYAKKITMEDHRGATGNPGLVEDAMGNLLPRLVTPREAKARHKCHKALELLIRDTGGKRI